MTTGGGWDTGKVPLIVDPHGHQVVCPCGYNAEPHPVSLADLIHSALRGHAFPPCEVCGASVDDPEAMEHCEPPA